MNIENVFLEKLFLVYFTYLKQLDKYKYIKYEYLK